MGGLCLSLVTALCLLPMNKSCNGSWSDVTLLDNMSVFIVCVSTWDVHISSRFLWHMRGTVKPRQEGYCWLNVKPLRFPDLAIASHSTMASFGLVTWGIYLPFVVDLQFDDFIFICRLINISKYYLLGNPLVINQCKRPILKSSRHLALLTTRCVVRRASCLLLFKKKSCTHWMCDANW